jgi:acyl-CoA synthetase (AMP-forming)/AMP-acid ligase II
MPSPDTLQQLRRELSANGEKAAVITFTGEAEETWSFAKLGDVSTRLAAGLARRGISRGDSVALIAPNSPQWIVAFWAIIGAGAVAVPLDAQSDDHDLKRMIGISACHLAFSTAADAKRLQVIASHLWPRSSPSLMQSQQRMRASFEYPGETGVCLQHLGILVGREARAKVWPGIISWLSRSRSKEIGTVNFTFPSCRAL